MGRQFRNLSQEVACAQLRIRQLELDRDARERRLRELEDAIAATEDKKPDLDDPPPLPAVMALGLVCAASQPTSGEFWRPTLRHKTANALMVTESKGDGTSSDGKVDVSEPCTMSSGGSSPVVGGSVPSTPDYSETPPKFLEHRACVAPISDVGLNNGTVRRVVQPPAPPQAPPVFTVPFEQPLLPLPPAPPTEAPTFSDMEHSIAAAVTDHAETPEVEVASQEAPLPHVQPSVAPQESAVTPTYCPVIVQPQAPPAEHPTLSLLSTSPQVAAAPCAPLQQHQFQQQPQPLVLGPPWVPSAAPVAPPAPVHVHAPWTQPCLWYCVTFLGGIDVRADPSADGRRTGVVMPQGTIFAVAESLVGFDGRIYLRLADGSGWAFDDSALMPGDPSVRQVAGVSNADGSGFVSTMPPEAAMTPAWEFCGQVDDVQQMSQTPCVCTNDGLQFPGELQWPQQPSDFHYDFTSYSAVTVAPNDPFPAPAGEAIVP